MPLFTCSRGNNYEGPDWHFKPRIVHHEFSQPTTFGTVTNPRKCQGKAPQMLILEGDQDHLLRGGGAQTCHQFNCGIARVVKQMTKDSGALIWIPIWSVFISLTRHHFTHTCMLLICSYSIMLIFFTDLTPCLSCGTSMNPSFPKSTTRASW